MGSDLFQARVVSRVDSTDFEPGPYFEGMGADFEEIAGEAFDVDLDDPTIAGLKEAAKAFAEGKSFDEVSEVLGYTLAFQPQKRDALLNDPTSLDVDQIDMTNWHWLGHSILHELFPNDIKPMTTSKVVFDVAQIHPDAGVPEDPFYLPPFALRLLAEASGDFFDNPIWAWFDRIEDSALLTLGGGADDALYSIVFGCGVIDRVPIVTGPEFGKGHEDAWWAGDERVRRLLSQGEHEDGFEAARLWIRVLPQWISNLEDGTFDSRAY